MRQRQEQLERMSLVTVRSLLPALTVQTEASALLAIQQGFSVRHCVCVAPSRNFLSYIPTIHILLYTYLTHLLEDPLPSLISRTTLRLTPQTIPTQSDFQHIRAMPGTRYVPLRERFHLIIYYTLYTHLSSLFLFLSLPFPHNRYS